MSKAGNSTVSFRWAIRRALAVHIQSLVHHPHPWTGRESNGGLQTKKRRRVEGRADHRVVDGDGGSEARRRRRRQFSGRRLCCLSNYRAQLGFGGMERRAASRSRGVRGGGAATSEVDHRRRQRGVAVKQQLLEEEDYSVERRGRCQKARGFGQVQAQLGPC